MRDYGGSSGRQCETASLFGNFFGTTALVGMHRYVWVSRLAFRPRGIKCEQQPIRVLGLPDITVHHLQREQYHPR